jgi:hypothetical protein
MRIILLSVYIFNLLIPVNAQRVDARLIDEFERYNCEDFIGRLDSFLAELTVNDGARGVIVLYEGKYPRFGESQTVMVPPVFGEVHSRFVLFRIHIQARNFDIGRIIFISGGFRENHYGEFWLVPRGSALPTPKPTLQTMRYRKGKPTSIFPSCP